MALGLGSYNDKDNSDQLWKRVSIFTPNVPNFKAEGQLLNWRAPYEITA